MQKTDLASWTDKPILLCLWTALAIVPLTAIVSDFLIPQVYLNPLLLKTLALRLIALALILGWSVKRFFSVHPLKKYTPLNIPISFYLTVAFLSTTFSVLPRISFYGERASFNGFLSVLIAMIFLLIASSEMPKRVDVLIKGLLTSTAVIASLGIAERLSLFPSSSAQTLGRTEATFSSPIAFGAFLALVFPIVSVLLFQSALPFKLLRGVFIWLLVLLALGLTGTLSAWLASLSGLGFFFVSRRTLVGRTDNKIAAWMLITLLLAFLLIIFLFGSDSLEGKINSLKGRLIIWRIALQITRDFPLLGAGQDTFLFISPRYQTPDWQSIAPIPSSTRFAHNQLLQTSAASGLIGFLSLLYLIILFFWYSLKKLPQLSVNTAHKTTALLSGAFAFLVYSLLGWSDFDVSVIFWIVIGLTCCLLRSPEQESSSDLLVRRRHLKPNSFRFACAAIFLMIMLVSTWTALRPILADNYFYQSLKSDPLRSRVKAENLLKKAIDLNPTEWRYRLLLARFYSLPPAQLTDLEKARQELELSLQSNPYDYDGIDLMLQVLTEEKKQGRNNSSEINRYQLRGQSVYPLHPSFQLSTKDWDKRKK